MKKLLDYKEYLPILALLIYSFGYVYNKVYYSNFGIEIEYYISFSDLLFFTIRFFIYIAFLLLITETVLIFIIYGLIKFILKIYLRPKKKINTEKEELLEKEVNKLLEDNYTGLSLVLLTVVFIVIILKFEQFIYPFTIYFLLFIVKLHKIISKNDPEVKDGEFTLVHFSTYMFLGFSLIAFIFIGFKEAIDIKESLSENNFKKIEFCIDDKFYSTFVQKNLVYIGETSNYIFMYDKALKSSSIFNKSEIKNLKILDPVILAKSEIEEVINFKIKDLIPKD